MKKYSEAEMSEMKAYLMDFVESFDTSELAQAVREEIISLEEIECAMVTKLKLYS